MHIKIDKWNNRLDKLKEFLTTPMGWLVLISIPVCLVWAFGWVRNAEYNAKYNLQELRDMYIWVATQLNAQHLINSKWNSEPYKNPKLTGGVNNGSGASDRIPIQ